MSELFENFHKWLDSASDEELIGLLEVMEREAEDEAKLSSDEELIKVFSIEHAPEVKTIPSSCCSSVLSYSPKYESSQELNLAA